MINDDTELIGDLCEINRWLSTELWNIKDVKSRPAGLSPRLVCPQKRGGDIRISEQEAKILCCGLLNRSNYYYSIETPTKQAYQQTGSTPMSALSDLSLYRFKDNDFQKVVNIEFKALNCAQKDIAKDIEKLGREQIIGNWFHTLKNIDRRSFRVLFKKFESAFLKYSETFSQTKISILFCFCIMDRKQAYIKHFNYKPQGMQYKEYVKEFFDPLQLNNDTVWDFWGDPNTKIGVNEVEEAEENDKQINMENKIKCEKLWEEPDFTIVQGTVGSSAQHKNKPRLWFLPEYFQVPSQGKGNEMFEDLCEILKKFFPDIRGKSKVVFDSMDFSWEKFKDFISEAKNICRRRGLN